MSEFLSGMKETFMLWKLFYLKAAFASFVTLGAAYQCGTANVAVGSLDKWERIGLAVNILVLWSMNMISLLDKTASQIQSGKLFDAAKDTVTK